eukprot:Protomagalhaensia_wolfi_Nauph_80__3210@NODE_3272_length_841_cov_17_344140_g2564_i0_p1_GENE_NODE_3272_length_841_cov_17_344140_g2564_i0NODE_3272_length_841_cov_17_344140_g2564_i0_p1_ORF_typecomplete_len176_score30_92Rogdi_lz/PF10259_9/0_043_NODE_3272_length_841_cov_17_344140_g2564_i0159686
MRGGVVSAPPPHSDDVRESYKIPFLMAVKTAFQPFAEDDDVCADGQDFLLKAHKPLPDKNVMIDLYREDSCLVLNVAALSPTQGKSVLLWRHTVPELDQASSSEGVYERISQLLATQPLVVGSAPSAVKSPDTLTIRDLQHEDEEYVTQTRNKLLVWAQKQRFPHKTKKAQSSWF